MKSLLTLFHRSRHSRPLQAGDAALDTFGRLPFELIFLILTHLEPGDLSAAARSSRSLRSVLLSDEVWPVLADRWFPSLADFIRLAAVNERKGSELFERALRRISRRISGKFASAVQLGMILESDPFFELSKNVPAHEGGVHSYDIAEEMDPDPEERFSRFMVYSNGRMAWWPEAYHLPYFAVVDNFRTRTRRAYLFPRHERQNRGYRTAMGDKLLLLCRETTVHAWHLELDRLQSFEVPETFKRCTTEGETVLVVCTSGDLFIWRYGQTLQRIEMSALPCYPKGPIGVGGLEAFTSMTAPFATDGLYLRGIDMLIDFIVSPIYAETFFVITYPGDSLRQLIVHEICSGEFIASYKLDVSILDNRNISDVGDLRSESIDCYGGYSLVNALMEDPNANRDAIAHNTNNETSCPCGRKSRELITVCFNIYSKSFTVLYHHLPRSLGNNWTFHIWNNRLSLRNDSTDRQSTLYEKYITSVEPCTSNQVFHDTECSVPIYSTIPTNSSFILQRHLLTGDSSNPCQESTGITFALNIYQQFTSGSQNPFQAPILGHKLVGDGDFLVFVQDKKYIVWSFGDEIPAKPAGTGQKKTWWKRMERDIR
ncbi:hypothetical protein F5X99DRAFT_391158 [Biscogniauxia marginata]|nr:hypothetical protein F5X99DRAFT_391158 [Biscogniauxia marginata]